MGEWTTLIGFCLANFCNGMGFGTLTNNIQAYAAHYSTTTKVMQNTFYIGLIVQILLCLFAIRLIEWRFDYAVISASYLTACSYWLQYLSFGNIIIVIASIFLNSVAQLVFLPSPLYLAQIWFVLEKRSFVIGLGFYSNLLGFGLGSTMSGLLSVQGSSVTIDGILLTEALLATTSFLTALVLVKNRPKVRIEAKKRVEWKHFKDLWRQKFIAYNIVVVSVFLGVAWTFLSQFNKTNNLLFSEVTASLNLTWILSGALFGIFMSWLVQKSLAKTGDFKYYDMTCKILLFLGICGNFVLGLMIQYNVSEFALYFVTILFTSIGTIGFFGMAFLSLIESMYPVPSLLIGTLIALFASVYSIVSEAVSQLFPQQVNGISSISFVTFLPWLYYVITYRTNFKRYKYYLNEKQSKFQLLKIQRMTYNSEKTKKTAQD